MSLKDQGFRFCISRDLSDGRWLHPAEQTAMYPDWLDVTDWPTEKLVHHLTQRIEPITAMEQA
jgi:hypothetical protein